MPKMTAFDPAVLRQKASISLEDIPQEVKTNVDDIVTHNEEKPTDVIHLEFDSPEEKAEWKANALAYAAHSNIRLRESGIRGRAENEGYFRAFQLDDES